MPMKILAFLLVLCSAGNQAVAQKMFANTWQGALNTGAIKLRLVFHITQKGDSLSATMDSPDQGAKDFPFSSAVVRGDSIVLGMIKAKATFTGRLTNDTTLDGIWAQGGAQLPLTLYKAEHLAAYIRNRPQEPKPTFAYTSEDVSYTGGANDVKLAGTLTHPPDGATHPAILLITGSGAQNRDEEIFGHKPFLLLADYFTRRGYTVLRVDDRGYGKSTGNFANGTTADFAKDAAASIEFLKKQSSVDKKKIGLIGHSEGGMIAEMLAAQRKDIDFIILLSAPGVKITKLMAEQNGAVAKSMKAMSDADIAAYVPLYQTLLEKSLLPYHPDHVYGEMSVAIDKWEKGLDTGTIARTTGMHGSEGKEAIIQQFEKMSASPWMRYFLAYNPQIYLRKISCKVLALGGSRDIQVNAATNLPAIKAALAVGGNKHYEVKELLGLNHLFQKCTACTVDEYKELEETFSPDALTMMGVWLDRVVK